MTTLRILIHLVYPIKTIYLILLVLMTLVILLGATWFGFYLAKHLATPLALLGDAAGKISKGEYETVRIDSGSREINQLVTSFNQMTESLSQSEKEIKEANKNLKTTLEILDEHNRYIEVVLSNVSAGVISVDATGMVTTLNPRAAELLKIDSKEFVGKNVLDILKGEHLLIYDGMISQMKQQKARSLQKEVRLQIKEDSLLMKLTLTLLKDEKDNDLGLVLVFDDLTELINAQRASAWREVARRIAHEIKNPLTPIKLSAQRLEKKFGDVVKDPAFQQCTEMIIRQVDDLKNLVNEFSQFARLPQIQPKLGSFNKVIENALVLYSTGHKNIQFDFKADSLPDFEFDPDQIGRVLTNLLENAVDAVKDETNGKIELSTQFDSQVGVVKLRLKDNGCGIPIDMRDRIFEPYFSTRESGTGLGLSIVKRIVEDHNGFIRVASNQPKGTEFVIELPLLRAKTITSDEKLNISLEKKMIKQKHKVLIVDDEKPICEVLSASLLDEGYEIEIAHDGEKGLKAIESFQPEVVLLDIWMPGKLDGIDVLQAAKQKFPLIDFIVMSGHGTIETAVKATKLGAWDFVEKPLSSDKIFILIKNIISFQQERNEKRALLNKLRKNFAILGHSQSIQELKKNISKAAASQKPAFVEGPIGTGKTLAAQNIHYLSERASQPFVEVNCKLVPQDLIDMQLFGFDKKHLIGVEEVQKGHLDLAQNGTLYLKEISYLNEETQRKVLKLIQTQTFTRVGQSKPISSDVRLLLSSTQDLKARVKSGEFLSELYTAISESVLFVPALKDRKDDIPVLIQHFSDFYAQESGTRAKIFETDAIEALMRYTWPGHVRELKNFVERVYILLEDDKVTAALLVEEGLIAGGNQEAMHASQLKVARSMFEKQYILRKLEENNGNVSKTAEMIGLERSHLHRKMKTYGIET